MNIVVVESPSKAKTINKYLGSGYEVLASFGHIRDLPPKDGSVDPDNDFRMLWEVDPQSQKRMNDIARALNISTSRVRTLILNWQLRTTAADADLRKSIVNALRKTRFSKDGTLLGSSTSM